MPKNGKFVLYASRKSGQLLPVTLTEETYTVLQQMKEQTNIPISTIAELAIDYAFQRVEIRVRGE